MNQVQQEQMNQVCIGHYTLEPWS